MISQDIMFSFITNPPYFGVTSRLCAACHSGDTETVKSLLNADNVNVKGYLGWAPLHKGKILN